MNKPFLLLLAPILMLASCGEQDHESKQASQMPRYSAQTFTVGGMVVVTQITDNKEGLAYLYELSDKDGLKLKNTIDLTKCGAQTIPFEEQKNDSKNEAK